MLHAFTLIYPQMTDGPIAGPMFEGEYESMKLINIIVPQFSPKPIAWGKCKFSTRHFNLFEFHKLRKGSPDIRRFTHAVAQLHKLSIDASLTGNLGSISPHTTARSRKTIPGLIYGRSSTLRACGE